MFFWFKRYDEPWLLYEQCQEALTTGYSFYVAPERVKIIKPVKR